MSNCGFLAADVFLVISLGQDIPAVIYLMSSVTFII